MSNKSERTRLFIMLALIMGGMFVIMLNQSIINIILPFIMEEFDITATTAQWLSTSFMLVNGLLMPLSAYFSEKFTYKQLFITSMVCFFVGSFICGMSSDFNLLLIGRILQAIGGGIISPLAMIILMAVFPPEKRGSAMGILGLGLILAPAIGPTLGGFVIEHYRWENIFYGMAVIAAIIIICSIFFFKFENERGKPKLDIFGVITSSIGLGALLYGVSEAGNKGWGDAEVITFLIVAVVSLTIFVLFELKKDNPLLEMRVFKNLNFTFTLIVSMVLQMALFGGMLLLPIYLQSVRGFTALESGLLLLPGSLLMGILGIFTGKIYDKVGIKPLAIIGITIVTVITFFLSKLSMDTPYSEILILYTIRSIGMAFVMMPISSAGLYTVTKELTAHATALQNTLRQVAGSIGTAIFIVIMSNQTKAYLKDLGAAVKPDSIKLATIDGINLAFFIATIVAIAALVLSFFFKSKKVLQKAN